MHGKLQREKQLINSHYSWRRQHLFAGDSLFVEVFALEIYVLYLHERVPAA